MSRQKARRYGWRLTFSYTPIKGCQSFWSWVYHEWRVISIYTDWKLEGTLFGYRFFGFTTDWERIKK